MRATNKSIIIGTSLIALLIEVLFVLTRYSSLEKLSRVHPQVPVILGLQIVLFILATFIVVTKRDKGILLLTLSIISVASVGYLAYVLQGSK